MKIAKSRSFKLFFSAQFSKVRGTQVCALSELTKVLILWMSTVFIIIGVPAAHAREVLDATRTKVKLVDHPNRVVTLVPSLGELAADLSDRHLERIVGVSEFTDYPPALTHVKTVGSYTRFNLEVVAALKPDLVLATLDGNSKDQIDHLRELGISVVVVRTDNFQDIEDSIRLIAQAMDSETLGNQLIARLKQGLEAIEKNAKLRLNAGKPVPRVLLQLDSSPLVVVGRSSFLNEALAKVGATNIYADTLSAYPRPSVEDAIRRNPDVIVVLGMGKNMGPSEKAAQAWKSFRHLKATQNGKIKAMSGDMILRPTLRVLEGLSSLEKVIHGERVVHDNK